ncbi:MAG TPA: NrfD/PsrC family molybdoenzyme membrane anchor subunit, partial [Pyrinomonadaceae bacterium]
GLSNSEVQLVSAFGPLWLWVAPALSGAFLAITGGLLIWDLEHPARFYMIFTRPQWRSWLVKGAFVIAGYSLVLALHFAASLVAGGATAQSWLMAAGVPLGVMTAVYTAYLFAQAKARDLWQNPLLPPHLLVQALLLGSAALMPFALWMEPAAVSPLAWTLGATSLAHLLMVWGEATLTHPTAHAHLAVWEMTRGRYAAFFWAGAALVLAAVFAPWLGLAAVPPALVGLALHEHAYVQSGQAVPLA